MSDVRTVSEDLPWGRTPASVEHPRSLEELRALLRTEEAETLVPTGQGNHLCIGAPPSGPFRLLELSEALGGPVTLTPEDMTLDLPASATLGEIDAGLRAAGQFLPMDPPLGPSATIGGVLASGLSGPLRTRYGLPREMVLGMSCLRADGEPVHAGGRVVKNVSGYDLVRLWCGSLGTLGIIVRVTLKVVPRPDYVDLVAEFPTLDAALAAALTTLRADLRPLAFELSSRGTPDSSWEALVRLEEAAGDGGLLVIPGAARLEAQDRYETARDAGFAEDDALSLRAAAPASLLSRLVQSLQELRPGVVQVRPLAGQVVAAWNEHVPEPALLASALSSLRNMLAPSGGSVVVQRRPDDFDGPVDPWGNPGDSLPLMHRVKETYDPRGRLNRGRFVGGI